jgi:threonyl-tRNA synthetase
MMPASFALTLPDGSRRDVPSGTRVVEFAESALPASVVRKALAAVVDGRMVDLTHPIEADATLRLVLPEGPEALALYRHSTAHLLAAAVTALFPGAQCGIGPATEEGFFYDFVVERPFVPEDLERIEAKMRELASQDLPYRRELWPRDEAMAFFRARGEPLKVQLIEEKTAGQSHVSCYLIKDRDTFVDFCVGPHVPSTRRLKAFKLLHTSNAYWKGDARGSSDSSRSTTPWGQACRCGSRRAPPSAVCSRSTSWSRSARRATSMSTRRISRRLTCTSARATGSITTRTCSRRWISKPSSSCCGP